MKLFLIRHGQSLNNARPAEDRVEDPSLTEVGHQQCSHLAEWIGSLNLTRVVSSPFLRTLQTADHIGRALGLVTDVRTDLHEQGGCMRGPAPDVMVGRPGMSRSQIRCQYPGFTIAPEIDDNGWWGSKPFETEEFAQKRAARLLAQTVAEFAGTTERVAYVMHADIGRLFLLKVHAGSLDMLFNTSVTKIVVSPEGCLLDEYNLVEHLPPDLVTM
jgi:2,3-bisphosphoglycerate-dependent phosphoglycerate mutase